MNFSIIYYTSALSVLFYCIYYVNIHVEKPKYTFGSNWTTSKPHPNKSLLSLVMIVKNEADTIQKVLESTKDTIDRYTILDTGSTDNTVDIILSTFKNVPGNIFTEPFVDFSTSRNRAIELDNNKSTFILMLSGNEYVRYGSTIRSFCQQQQNTSNEVFNIRIKYGPNLKYDSARIFRSKANWFYVGSTHEYLTNSTRHIARDKIIHHKRTPYIYHDRSTTSPEQQQRRCLKDIPLLKKELKSKSASTRTLFYLAQSYQCTNQWKKAYSFYKRRINEKSGKEEIYESMYRLAIVSEHLNYPWIKIQQLYLNAFEFSKSNRSEPLYKIAKHYYDKEEYYSAFLFLKQASEIEFPKDWKLFVTPSIYHYDIPYMLANVSYYLNKPKVGLQQIYKLLKHTNDPIFLQMQMHFQIKLRE